MPGKNSSAPFLPAEATYLACAHLAGSWLLYAPGQFSSFLDLLNETNALIGNI